VKEQFSKSVSIRQNQRQKYRHGVHVCLQMAW